MRNKPVIWFSWLIIAVLIIFITQHKANTDNLDTWVGDYLFSEGNGDYHSYAVYYLDIYAEGDHYLGELRINSWMVGVVATTSIRGDSEAIEVVFLEYHPDYSMLQGYKEGDMLFRLIKEGDIIKTEWGAIEPIIEDNPYTQNGICFDKTDAAATEIIAANDSSSSRADWRTEFHGQIINIDLHHYYGDWLVGEAIGTGYYTDDIDPHGRITGGILTLSEDTFSFSGPKGTIILENPSYEAVLELPYEFATIWRAHYSSFGFHNAFVVRLDFFEGDDYWAPFGLGPFWIRDMDSLIAGHNAYHVLTRIDASK